MWHEVILPRRKELSTIGWKGRGERGWRDDKWDEERWIISEEEKGEKKA
jgi:hypothetical protein